jgi:hypothetical protein
MRPRANNLYLVPVAYWQQAYSRDDGKEKRSSGAMGQAGGVGARDEGLRLALAGRAAGKCAARGGGAVGKGEEMTRDEYLAVILDIEARYEALGETLDSMRRALAAGCFTDPAPTAQDSGTAGAI